MIKHFTLAGLLSAVCIIIQTTGFSQASNFKFSNSEIEEVLNANFNSDDYSGEEIEYQEMLDVLSTEISDEKLKDYIIQLGSFETRHTSSDTLSETTGIGAAREYILETMTSQAGTTMLTGFFQFEEDVCGITQHKNVLGVIPGTDPEAGILIFEGHFDSRCEERCDFECEAQGIEDNATGTALVMELARIFAPYRFKRTIVFMPTTGEEQGLIGATAMSDYLEEQEIPVFAVLNNDVIGGVICGETSSAPSCPGLNDIDSTQVRIFSFGAFNSPQKQLARYVKRAYEREILPERTNIPMTISIMTGEDRIGRGGDHIPFRQAGVDAIRFTSANEHGDASVGPDYSDRQHTGRDDLGEDTNGDGEIDSFFVSFTYLQRNAIINANAGTALAFAPENRPEISSQIVDFSKVRLSAETTGIDDIEGYQFFVRSVDNEFDTVIYSTEPEILYEFPEIELFSFSVATVNSLGVESKYSSEIRVLYNALEERISEQKLPLELLQNVPNPFDDATTIGVHVFEAIEYQNAQIRIVNQSGQIVRSLPIQLNQGSNEVTFEHGYGTRGILHYTLVVDGKDILTKTMVFAG